MNLLQKNKVADMRKVGILVVYFLNDRDIEILDIHLKSIEKYSAFENYTIFAVAIRVSDQVIDRLKAYKNLKLLDLPQTNERASREHSYYLDLLAKHAVSENCTHIITLDCDAWPIRDNWLNSLCESVNDEKPVTAVLRKEIGEDYFPHPCMTCFSAEFYKNSSFDFFPEQHIINQDDFKKFLSETKQCPDSGIGLAYFLYHHHIQWTPLLRSNKVNDHYLLGGIYGDIIFHLGSMSWGKRSYRPDILNSPIIRFAIFIKTHIIHCPQGSLRRKIVDSIDKSAFEKIYQRNEESYTKIRSELLKDAEKYMAYLSDTI